MGRTDDTFQIRYGGETWTGAWRISNGEVIVTSEYGQKITPASGAMARPRVLAEMMLKELVQAYCTDLPRPV